MKIFISLCITVLFLFQVLCNPISISSNDFLSNGPMQSAWPMKCYDQSHSSQSPYNTIKNNGQILWKYKSSGSIESDIVIDDEGVIYFGDFNGFIYAINENGTLKWKYKLDGKIYSSAAIDNDGDIYCPSRDFYAFYPDGTLKWRFDFGEDLVVGSSSPAISNDGIIYIGVTEKGVNGGYIFSIDDNGQEKWRLRIGNFWVESSPCIGSDGTIYIGSVYDEHPEGTYGYLCAIGKNNIPPSNPTINGPSSGRIGNSYSYSFMSTDHENDQIYYYIDWGDETNSGWKGPYESGQTASESHIWDKLGDQTIRVKAKNENELESEWSELEVRMPKNKIFENYFYRLRFSFSIDSLFRYLGILKK